MRVLVTGCNGFVGVNLVDLLQRAGHEIAGTDLMQSVVLDKIGHTGPRLFGVDVRSPGGLRRAVHGADAVVHLAALPGVLQSQEDPLTTFHVNALGALHVLEACRKTLATDTPTKRVILASSGAADECRSPYGAAKAAVEAMATSYWHSYGLETVCLRFTNVYGPWSGQKGSAVGRMIQTVQAGEPITVDGDGSQTRDFIHVTDVCRAINAALGAPAISGRYLNIGTGIQTSINELIATIQLSHGDGEIKLVAGQARPIEQQGLAVVPAAATAAMGWKATTSLQDGVQQLYRWFQDNTGTEPDAAHTTPLRLVSVVQLAAGSDMWRISYHDERGFSKTSDVSRKTCGLAIARFRTSGRTTELNESLWLQEHIPE